MRILLTGSTGQVGSALAPLLAPFGEVLTPTRADLDLASEPSIRTYLRSTKPQWIINPAAYTAVDAAESNRDLAFAINAEAPRILGEEALALHASVIHFSTDYVFDGAKPAPYTEFDTPAPINIYGVSKLAGELALAASSAAYVILRTSWVYSATGKNFLLTILNAARTRPDLRIVADQYGAPTSASALAALTAHIVATNADLKKITGTYHATASGHTSWHGFAEEILREAKRLTPTQNFAKLTAIPTADYPTPAPRPLNSRLDCTKLSRELNYQLPPWQASFAEVISQVCR